MSDLEHRLREAFGRHFTSEEIARLPVPPEVLLDILDRLRAGAAGALQHNSPAAYFLIERI